MNIKNNWLELIGMAAAAAVIVTAIVNYDKMSKKNDQIVDAHNAGEALIEQSGISFVPVDPQVNKLISDQNNLADFEKLQSVSTEVMNQTNQTVQYPVVRMKEGFAKIDDRGIYTMLAENFDPSDPFYLVLKGEHKPKLWVHWHMSF